MRDRALRRVILVAFASCMGMPSIAAAAKQPIVLVGVNVHPGEANPRAKNTLADALGKQLVSHLQMMGESIIVPGARELTVPCDRDCQVRMAQQKHGDILGIDIERQGSQDYDISFSLWRFDEATGRPLTEYPLQRQASCDQCSEQQLIQTTLEHTGKLLDRSSAPPPVIEPPPPAIRLSAIPATPPPPALTTTAPPAAPPAALAPVPVAQAPVASPSRESPPPSSSEDSGSLISAISRRSAEGPRLSTGRRVAAGIMGVLSGLSLGAGGTMHYLDSQLHGQDVPGQPGRKFDFTTSYAACYGVGGGLALITVLVLAIPGKSAPRPTMLARR